MISVLVTYEDDFPLLRKSALEILSTLYMLQLKLSPNTRSRSSSTNNPESALSPVSVDPVPPELQEPDNDDKDRDVRTLASAALAKV